MFGTSRKKLEKQQYEANMQKLKAQQEMEVRMLQRQAQLQAATIATDMTTADYRGQYTMSQDNTSTILRNVQADVRQLHDEVTKLKGFYGWMIHAYPETIAQYKALMDLQQAASNNEVGEQRVTSSY